MASQVEWRRRWKPDLISQPWTMLSVEGIDTISSLLLKSNFTESGYEVLFSDKTNIWHENLKIDDVTKRSKKLNPSVEAPTSKLLDHLQDRLQSDSQRISCNYKNLADSDSQKILVTLNTKLAGLPFIWTFSGMPGDGDMVCDHLVKPLLTMTGELLRRQNELYKLLHNKDKEIDDLKAQGVKVTRKHLETGPFDDIAFKNNMIVSKGFEQQVSSTGSMLYGQDGQTLYRELMTKQAYTKHDPQLDDDGDMFDDDMPTMSGVGGTMGGATGGSWTNRIPASLATAGMSPRGSPTKSPAKSSADDTSPSKDIELQRRHELEARLAAEAERKNNKKKKKKLRL